MKTAPDPGLIGRFTAARRLALAGVSRDGSGFGNAVLKELTAKGYDIVPVHPAADMVGGRKAFRTLAGIEPGVEGVVVVLPPPLVPGVIREAAAAGIGMVWLQQGAESAEALRTAGEVGVDLIHGQCIMMYARPTGVHSFHAWLWRVLGLGPRSHVHKA